MEYSKRLGPISTQQFQAALDHFNLGQFIRAEAIPFGLFGQNVFVTSTAGEFVLRGAAHYDWQFPKEQFIARLIHEQTDVPAPWPYLLDTGETIFGWKHGYVLMPRLPGLQLANKKVLKTIAPQDRKDIAFAMGQTLGHIRQAQWRFAGQYDHRTQAVEPFKRGFAAWLVNDLRQWLQTSLSYNTGATQADAMWVEHIVQDAEEALKTPYTPALVLRDYKEGNLTVQKQDAEWKVSGVFDLMEALFGDSELDIVRQLAAYMEETDLTLAKSFLDGFQQSTGLRPGANKRLALYMVYDRMIVWEYFHRPANVSKWQYDEKSVEEWISPYLDKLSKLLKSVGHMS